MLRAEEEEVKWLEVGEEMKTSHFLKCSNATLLFTCSGQVKHAIRNQIKTIYKVKRHTQPWDGMFALVESC